MAATYPLPLANGRRRHGLPGGVHFLLNAPQRKLNGRFHSPILLCISGKISLVNFFMHKQAARSGQILYFYALILAIYTVLD
jgi:hypothetical protein